MRKLDIASNADGSVRRESCNQEEVTAFYAIEFAEGQIRQTLEMIGCITYFLKQISISTIARRKSNVDHPRFAVLVTLHGLNGIALLELFCRAIYGQSYDERSH